MAGIVSDFDRAARVLDMSLDFIRAHVLEPEGRIHLNYIPPFCLESWSNIPRNRCYNFALDRRTDSNLHPGEIANTVSRLNFMTVDDLAESLHVSLIEDGLHFLGSSFQDTVDHRGAPVFAFVGELLLDEEWQRDFHFYALRKVPNSRDIVIAGKPAEGNPDIIVQGDNNAAAMFADAAQRGYERFLGCYVAPDALRTLPRLAV